VSKGKEEEEYSFRVEEKAKNKEMDPIKPKLYRQT
jgi:hypothetical protein